MSNIPSLPGLIAQFQHVPVRLLLWQKHHKVNKRGTAPISIRITIGGRRAEVSTGIRLAVAVQDATGVTVKESEWDTERNQVRGDSALANKLNEELQLLLAHVREVILMMKAVGRPITPKALKEQLQTPGSIIRQPCFIVLCRAMVEKHYLAGNAATYERMVWSVGLLNKWRGKERELPLDTFTPALASDFYTWLLSTGKNGRKRKPSSASAIIEGIVAAFNRAVADELVNPEQNPFRRLKRQPSEPVHRLRLTKEQLHRVRDAPLDAVLSAARDVYMTQYYLHGSRVGAVLLLRWSNIAEGYVNFKAEKGGPYKSIPIRAHLQQILDRYPKGDKPDKAFLFPFLPADFHVLSAFEQRQWRNRATARINARLQEIASLVGIRGNLHSHTARHTLAMHAAETSGLRVAQTMLGHKEQRQTEEYIGELRDSVLTEAEAKIYGDEGPTQPLRPGPPTAPTGADLDGCRIIPFRLTA